MAKSQELQAKITLANKIKNSKFNYMIKFGASLI
jgi:hypothetical protein